MNANVFGRKEAHICVKHSLIFIYFELLYIIRVLNFDAYKLPGST